MLRNLKNILKSRSPMTFIIPFLSPIVISSSLLMMRWRRGLCRSPHRARTKYRIHRRYWRHWRWAAGPGHRRPWRYSPVRSNQREGREGTDQWETSTGSHTRGLGPGLRLNSGLPGAHLASAGGHSLQHWSLTERVELSFIFQVHSIKIINVDTLSF